MNTGQLIGSTIEIVLFLLFVIYLWYLHFNQNSEAVKSLRRLPVTRVMFKYKYSFIVFSILILIKVLIDIFSLLSKL